MGIGRGLQDEGIQGGGRKENGEAYVLRPPTEYVMGGLWNIQK